VSPDDLCSAYCRDLIVSEIPIGFAVRTPCRKKDGDYIGVYLRRVEDEPEQFRVEDDGDTIAALEFEGIDLDNDTRFEVFATLLSEYGAHYDENECLIYGDKTFQINDAGCHVITFSHLLLRLQDLYFLSRDKVEATFRADLASAIERDFAQSAEILYNEPINDRMRDYIVDIIIRQHQKQLAIFAGSSENRALEALLFWQVFKSARDNNTIPVIVLENSKPGNLKQRTLARIMNSGLRLASFKEDEASVMEKLRETLEHG